MFIRRHLAVIAIGALTLLAFAGLAAAGGRNGNPVPPPPTTPPASEFVSTVDNPYFPLKPGRTLRYTGTKDGHPSSVATEVTRETKVILGVRCTVVHDTLSVDGAPHERTIDWYAQDKNGTVWYFGEESLDLVNGTWVRSGGSWQAGVDGATAGIIMEAHPRRGDIYRQEYYAGHAEDVARVLGRQSTVTVPYGYFDDVLKTRDWTTLDPRSVEHKYYAPGIGETRVVQVKGGSDEESLVAVEDN
jgi:hypothetical protein